MTWGWRIRPEHKRHGPERLAPLTGVWMQKKLRLRDNNPAIRRGWAGCFGDYQGCASPARQVKVSLMMFLIQLSAFSASLARKRGDASVGDKPPAPGTAAIFPSTSAYTAATEIP